MAKVIGLQIQLNGVSGVVKDIKTFETEIKKAKEDLKELEIGSDLFIQLQQEIGLAETQLLSLIQSTKRLTREREIEGIGKLGQGIASSFAAAQASIALFGTETEEVSKAAADAQNLLTLALSARGLAEVRLGAQLVARTIAQRAATASDLVQITVLKQLFAVIAANPYGALITVLGALVAAYFALSSEQEETSDTTKTLNELLIEQETATIAQVESLKVLRNILFDTNATLLEQEGAYLKLQKLVPDLAVKNFNLRDSQDAINLAIDREIKLIGLRAKQKAAEQFLVQEETKKIQKREVERERYLKSLNIELAQERQRLALAGESNEEIERVIGNITAERLEKKGLLDVNQSLEEVTREIIKLEAEQQAIIKKVKEATDGVKKSVDNRNKALRALADNLRRQIKLQADLLFQEVELGDADATIIKNLEERISKSKDLTSKTNQLKTARELLLETEAEIAGVEDKVGNAFSKATEKSETFFDSLKDIDTKNPEELLKRIDTQLENYKKGLDEIRTSTPLTPELEAELRNVENIYVKLVQGLKQFIVTEPPFDVEEWEKTLVDFSLKTGKILTDPYKNRTQDEIAEAVRDAEERYQKIREDYIKSFTAKQQEERKNELAVLYKDRETNAELIAQIEKEIADAANKSFENLEKQGQEILVFEDGVRRVGVRAALLNAELAKLSSSARLGFVIENAEELADEFGNVFDGIAVDREKLSKLQEKLRKKDFSVDTEYAQLLSRLQQRIGDELVIINEDGSETRIDITELEYEERLLLLEKFLTSEVELIENSEDKKKKARAATLKDIEQGLRLFSDSIGEIASIENQFAQLRLDKLEIESEKTLDSIVGDSEEAAKKREEIETQFQAKKAEIEKASLIKNLEFQLIQATADAAQAVVANLENPVLATIAGILGAAQIAVIARQLEFARSAAGGTIISGPSHEFGGVRAGGGLEVEGGESIINRVSTINYQGLLSSINQAGGGQALINNASQSLMEERLLQAMAKTKNEPIRAYVLNSEITTGQAINKRLEELSTL